MVGLEVEQKMDGKFMIIFTKNGLNNILIN